MISVVLSAFSLSMDRVYYLYTIDQFISFGLDTYGAQMRSLCKMGMPLVTT